MLVIIPLLADDADDEFGSVTVVSDAKPPKVDPKKDFDPRLVPEPQLQEIAP